MITSDPANQEYCKQMDFYQNQSLYYYKLSKGADFYMKYLFVQHFLVTAPKTKIEHVLCTILKLSFFFFWKNNSILKEIVQWRKRSIFRGGGGGGAGEQSNFSQFFPQREMSFPVINLNFGSFQRF